MKIWTEMKVKFKPSLIVAVLLVVAQLFTGLGVGVLTPNTVYAANKDVWWFELTADNEGNGLIFRDQIPKNISWNFVNMMGFDYLAGDNYANLNFRDIVGRSVIRFNGQLPAPTTGDYNFYIEMNTHGSNLLKQDEARLWVDGKLLIDTFGSPAVGEVPLGTEDDPLVPIELTAGQIYDIRMELVTKSGVPQSNIVLRWAPPSGSKTQVIDLVTAPPDVSPPTTVTDATYGTISSHSIDLHWTAPGSDDIVLEGPGGTELLWGTVSSYEIRYSTDPVGGDENAWWDNANILDHDLIPANAGRAQSITVENLAEETTYHFAIRSKDESDNPSAISNIVSVSTLAPDLTPPAAVQDLAVSYDDTTKLISATWTAPGDDGNEGTATSYDLRYDVKPIVTEDDWNEANVVSGLPVPEAAGTLQSVELKLDWEKTYYFMLKTTDKEGNVSEFSNLFEFTTPSLPIGVMGKIPVNPSMVYNEWYPHVDRGQNGGSKAMFDEQELAGDPLNGEGGIPEVSMQFGSSSYNRYYSSVVVDLGEVYELDYIYLYYGGGSNTGNIEIYAGEHFNWTKIHEDSEIKGSFWSEVDLQSKNIVTRYLRFIIDPVESRRAINEVVLYGKRTGTGMDPEAPEPTEHIKPFMHEYIGINGFRDDPLDVLSVAGNIREYHNWSLEVGSLPNGEIDTDFPHQYPNNINYFNPSSCCGGDMYYDDYFKMLHDEGIMVFPAIQGTLGYLGEKFGDKPVFPVDPLTDTEKPESYRVHADHMYQFTARYGSNEVPDEHLKLAEGQPRVSGLGYIEYFENGNETNAFWGTRSENMTPYEFAAMLSADYDGHERTIVNENGEHTYGVKNADPNAKMVMAGLAGYSFENIVGIHRWAQANRTDGKFPADVLNVHFYANSSGDDQSNSVVGISPEDFNLKERMREIADYRDRYLPEMEFWVSEFGYDTHHNSPQRAPAFGSFSAQEVQAQWLVRTYLILAAAGVDKAQMYMIRDVRNDGGKFNTSGLVTMKGEWDKKISWYYVYTLKNRLMNLRFQDEPESGDPNVMIQTYENAAGETKAYVVWAPTSEEKVVKDYKLQLPATTTQADLVLLVDKSTVGEQSPLTIAEDNTVTIDVSERPLFVMLDGAAELQTPDWPADSLLEVSDMTETELTLSWNDLSDAGVTWYQVLQNGEELAMLPSDVTSFRVTGLEPGMEYLFSVQASEIAGIWGDDGPSIIVKSADITNPTQPTGLSSNLASDSKVSLFWNAATDNVAVTGYRIYANGNLVLTVDGDTLNAGVIGLVPRTTYEFVVTAIDAAGNESEASDSLTVTTESRPSGGGGGGAPVNTGGMPGAADPDVERVNVPVNPARSTDGTSRYQIFAADLERAMNKAKDSDKTVLSLDFDDVQFELRLTPEELEKLQSDNQEEPAISFNSRVPQNEAASAKEAASQQGMTIHSDIHQLQFSGEIITGYEELQGTMILDGSLNPAQATMVKWNAESGKFIFVPAVFTAVGDKTVVQFQPRGEGQYMIVDRYRQFNDIEDSWAKADIELLVSKMIINGRDADTFAPKDVINRAEFASLIVQATGLGDITWDEAIFQDVLQDDWYHQAAAMMQHTGMMIGYDGQFHPEDRLTREQAIVVLHRLMQYAGYDEQVSDTELQILRMYNDAQKISDWSREAITALIKAGVVPSGFSNQVFAPQEYITREECASLLRKALQSMGYI